VTNRYPRNAGRIYKQLNNISKNGFVFARIGGAEYSKERMVKINKIIENSTEIKRE
jgi:hypothetical protein